MIMAHLKPFDSAKGNQIQVIENNTRQNIDTYGWSLAINKPGTPSVTSVTPSSRPGDNEDLCNTEIWP